MKTKILLLILLPLALSVSACGDTWGQRAVTGGAHRRRCGPGRRRPGGLAAARPGAGRRGGRCRHRRGHATTGGHQVGCSGSAQQQPELPVEDAQHVFEAVAVGELARPVVDHVAALARRPAPWRWRTAAARRCGGRSRRSPCPAGSRWRSRAIRPKRPACCRDSAAGTVPGGRRRRSGAGPSGRPNGTDCSCSRACHAVGELLQKAARFAKPRQWGAMNRRQSR